MQACRFRLAPRRQRTSKLPHNDTLLQAALFGMRAARAVSCERGCRTPSRYTA